MKAEFDIEKASFDLRGLFMLIAYDFLSEMTLLSTCNASSKRTFLVYPTVDGAALAPQV